MRDNLERDGLEPSRGILIAFVASAAVWIAIWMLIESLWWG